MASEVRQLDTSAEIVTPENIAFRYRIAGPFRRLPAYAIDLAVRTAMVLAGLITGLVIAPRDIDRMVMGITLVAWFCMAWFYGGLFETFWNGQTPGKWFLRIRVVATDGQPINAWQAILRNVLRAIDAQPLGLYQVAFWTTMLSARFQRLGDLACGTMVVVEERHQLQAVLPSGEPEAARVAALLPANAEVSRSLGLALVSYVQRRRSFSPGRRLEIAAHLAEPLRQKFQLPPEISADLLLCALYERTFLADGDLRAAAGRSAARTAVSKISDFRSQISDLKSPIAEPDIYEIAPAEVEV